MDGYFDDGITISLDLPAVVDHAATILSLALHLTFCPLAEDKSICHINIISFRKLAAEGTL
eukprot:8058365-Ditylum_brightwellii.AAC.1